MRYCKILFLFFIGVSFLSSKPLTYEEIIQKPKSITKDYYIYRLLNETNSTTKEQIETLYEQTNRLSPTLQNIYYKKLSDSEKFKKEIRCKGLSAQHMLDTKDEECIMYRVSPPIVTHLNSTQKAELVQILQNNPYTKSWVEAMMQENVFEALKKTGAKQFLTVFNSVNKEYREKYLDKPLPEEFISELEPLYGYSAMLRHIVYSKAYLKNIPKSLLYVPNENSNITSESAFLLGLFALKHENEKLADIFFAKSYDKAYLKIDKDKALFWRYLSTKNEDYLKNLSESFDINIYSVYAKEYYDIPIDTAYYVVLDNNKTNNHDITDPFIWNELRAEVRNADSDEELTKLIDKYAKTDTLPIYASALEKLAKYQKTYFITPYSEYLKDTNLSRQVMIYAIARQESRFVPATVSTSYALGTMQFMPFLARDIAKKNKIKDFDLDDMFKPEVAYKFANIHLDYLDEYLHHPLFTAYAYNGGIGFTRRMLETKTKFYDGKYEPFMSMETIANNEAREYGKKVLTNYVMYSKFLGHNVTLKSLFEELTKPELTDKFRH